jgi:hypothetical protein
MSEFSSFEFFQVDKIFTNAYEFSKEVAEKTSWDLAEKEKKGVEKAKGQLAEVLMMTFVHRFYLLPIYFLLLIF